MPRLVVVVENLTAGSVVRPFVPLLNLSDVHGRDQ